jgi:hypothetical protein
MCQVHGYAFLRLKFYDIIKFSKKHKLSLNEALYNSKILKKFKTQFYEIIECSLM